jgi:hypothetical protein
MRMVVEMEGVIGGGDPPPHRVGGSGGPALAGTPEE